ncbi:CarD family transcriptional regulator [Bradyrhizobium sp. SZCCHNR2009]|uniref:CarD family transcriptional regulator n=1 Tax=Bradyrhizobium sp. SZCCHNR2009 TaxID=3057375 RepID=UPI0028F15D21|nr:CarD family transcriptional regulator [Bradyrhizobium sp. SZCCHNR2009]
MPEKTAKTAAKATAAKTSAVKTSAVKASAVKSSAAKVAAKPAVAAPKPAAAPKAAVAAPAPAKTVAAKPAAPAPRVEEKKLPTQRQGFKTNEFVVYPAHGVGQILAIEEQEIAGAKLELFVINFIKDKMTLRVPTAKVANVGMRKLSDPALVKKALETLKGRARVKRTMWSRRAQEYEAKINSGDIVAIAEVVRDLYRSESQPEQSYSERQLYEAALDRLSREIAVVQHSTETEAVKEIEGQLAKSPRRGAKTEADAVAEGEGDAEGDIDDIDGDDTAVADEAA